MAVSRAAIYSLLGIFVIAALVYANGGEPDKIVKKEQLPKGSNKRGVDADWNFPVAETAIRFEKPKGAIRNIFAPLIGDEKEAAKTDQDKLMKIPANLAAGEADWAYTGLAEVNGVKMALLENPSNHQGGYVKEGETWKKSRVEHITLESITIAGVDGSEQTVFRYNANLIPKLKPMPDAGFRPMDLSQALNGPIGIQLSPGGVEADPPASRKRGK